MKLEHIKVIAAAFGATFALILLALYAPGPVDSQVDLRHDNSFELVAFRDQIP